MAIRFKKKSVSERNDHEWTRNYVEQATASILHQSPSMITEIILSITLSKYG